MGAFSEGMRAVGLDLITQFGNDCILTKDIVGNKVYNPLTDEYTGTNESLTYNTKCVFSSLEEGGRDKEENPKIKRIASIPYDSYMAELDTTWKLDDNEIYKVTKVMSQNDILIFKVYIG